MESVKTVSARKAVSERNYQRARARALVRLREAHLAEYQEYLKEERIRDEEESRIWRVDDNNSSIIIRTRSYKDTIESGSEPTNYSGENQGNYGGEE